MTYFLEFLNNVIVPFFAGLAIPVFAIATVVFVIIYILRKGRPGRGWLVIGIPALVYAAVGLLWILANILGGATSVPDNDLLPSATYER
ncbi:MAG: hypothetical protein QOE22_528 [Candidatus Parcubacteria bacterium]|jgi:hypothetical protein|nr:hypothetical protein [Candidatus Parcubacteria bacterium]